jgi:hypothetical protein
MATNHQVERVVSERQRRLLGVGDHDGSEPGEEINRVLRSVEARRLRNRRSASIPGPGSYGCRQCAARSRRSPGYRRACSS